MKIKSPITVVETKGKAVRLVRRSYGQPNSGPREVITKWKDMSEQDRKRLDEFVRRANFGLKASFAMAYHMVEGS